MLARFRYDTSCGIFGLSLVHRYVRTFISSGESGSSPNVLLNGAVLVKQPRPW